MDNSFPLGLRHALESGDCVLFIGAGIGSHLKNPAGKSAPDGETLAKELAAYFTIEIGDNPDLAKIAQIVEIRKGRAELLAFLKQSLAE